MKQALLYSFKNVDIQKGFSPLGAARTTHNIAQIVNEHKVPYSLKPIAIWSDPIHCHDCDTKGLLSKWAHSCKTCMPLIDCIYETMPLQGIQYEIIQKLFVFVLYTYKTLYENHINNTRT